MWVYMLYNKQEKACPSCSIKKEHAFSFIPDALTNRKNKTELNVQNEAKKRRT